MKQGYLNIFCLILALFPGPLHGQVNCTVPAPPVFTLVSVQPETGFTDFTWSPSPSSDIAAYIVYTFRNGDGIALDTIWDPSATSYTARTNASKYFSVSYVVASYRLPGIPGTVGCPSPLSNSLNTIFTATEIDTCQRKITVRWNPYSSVPRKVLGYSVLVAKNGSTYIEAGSLSSEAGSFELLNFDINASYCFVVRANLEGGFYSTSNKSCLSTKMVRPPVWINADYATTGQDGKISLSFTVDPLSEITRFSLERKAAGGVSYREIAQLTSSGGKVKFTDPEARTDSIYQYRLAALNSCKIPVTLSNMASNIVLSIKQEGPDMILAWNSYRKWEGAIDSYRIFADTGNGFEEKAVAGPQDTVIRLDYKDIMNSVTGREICFYVSSAEKSNPHGINSESRSQDVCIPPFEVITVPNVFTPDNDLVNDHFRPVLSFVPIDYYLLVSDRQGRVLFETRDYSVSWDGRIKGGDEATGVCLWFLKVTVPSGKAISRTGTVTIIRNR